MGLGSWVQATWPACPPEYNGEPAVSSTFKNFKLTNLRYWVLFVSTCVSSAAFANNFTFNFGAICRVNSSTDLYLEYKRDPNWPLLMYLPTHVESFLYAAFSVGLMIGLIAISLWKNINHSEIRYFVFAGSVVSSFCTMIFPSIYQLSFNALCVLKVIQGLAATPTIPLIGHLTKWTVRGELGMFVAFMTATSQFGIFAVMFASGPLCDRYGWRSIFWFIGTLSMALSFLFVIFYRDKPATHPYITQEELEAISNDKEVIPETPVPLKKFYTSKSVWACLLATVGNYNGITPLITFAPLILKKGLHFTDISTSVINGGSFLAQIVLKLVSGRLSDSWNRSETYKVIIFNTLSCFLSGLVLLRLAFVPESEQFWTAVGIFLAQAFIGLNSAGFNKAAVIVTKQYSPYMTSIMGFIMTTSTIIHPFIVSYMAPDSTWEQWCVIFVVCGSILCGSHIIFCIWIRCQPAEFTRFNVQLDYPPNYTSLPLQNLFDPLTRNHNDEVADGPVRAEVPDNEFSQRIPLTRKISRFTVRSHGTDSSDVPSTSRAQFHIGGDSTIHAEEGASLIRHENVIGEHELRHLPSYSDVMKLTETTTATDVQTREE